MALTLRLLGGLTAAEIARAFLTSESAIQQRIVRAKRTLSEARVPFEVPGAAERAAATRIRARSHLSDLQRRLRGDGRGGLDASGAVRRSAAPGQNSRRDRPDSARGPRPGRPDGATGLPNTSTGERIGRTHSLAASRIGACGINCSSAEDSRRWRVRRVLAAHSAPIPCRAPSRPVTPGHARRRRPIGRESSLCTMRSMKCSRRPS